MSTVRHTTQPAIPEPHRPVLIFTNTANSTRHAITDTYHSIFTDEIRNQTHEQHDYHKNDQREHQNRR